MYKVGDVLVSEDVSKKEFVCNLQKCKGACCVEGELGAPLEGKELSILEDIQDDVMPYLSEKGRQLIEDTGVAWEEGDNEYATPLLENGECAYAIYDDQNILKCGIEQAYNDGKVSFKKPLSCHLYPIRIVPLKVMEAVNYEHWEICNDACVLGEQLNVPVYKFLKEPLIRKYGEEWYNELCLQVTATEQQR